MILSDYAGAALLITAIGGTIFAPIWNSRSRRKEKEFDFEMRKKELELEQLKKIKDKELEELMEREKSELIHNYVKLNGYLQHILISTKLDRVSVIQPHPSDDHKYISISYEILNSMLDIVSHKDTFQNQKIEDWQYFVGLLSNEDFYVQINIEKIPDKKLYAEFHRRGVKTVIINKLTTNEGYWKGSICVEYIMKKPSKKLILLAKDCISKKLILISDVLPEYKALCDEST